MGTIYCNGAIHIKHQRKQSQMQMQTRSVRVGLKGSFTSSEYESDIANKWVALFLELFKQSNIKD